MICAIRKRIQGAKKILNGRCYLIWENSAQPFSKNRLVQATPKFQVLLKVQVRNSILEQTTGQKSAE